jgi:hypothetical protein
VVERVTILSEAGAPCRLENPFGNAGFVVQGIAEDRVGIEGDELRFATAPGLRVVLTRASGERRRQRQPVGRLGSRPPRRNPGIGAPGLFRIMPSTGVDPSVRCDSRARSWAD